MAEPPLPIRCPVQADEAVPEDAHPRGTLIVITLFRLPFATTLALNLPVRVPGARGDDLNANFTFPKQDIITRQRFFGGFKLKLSVVFVAAQVEIALAGSSRDGSQAMGAVDRSGVQQTYSLSAGFDF